MEMVDQNLLRCVLDPVSDLLLQCRKSQVLFNIHLFRHPIQHQRDDMDSIFVYALDRHGRNAIPKCERYFDEEETDEKGESRR
nr:unnamed protein product [Callosobruchus chinensis]